MTKLKKITIGIIWVTIFLFPPIAVYCFLRVPDFDFSIKLTPESGSERFLLLPSEAINLFNNKLLEFERIDSRLQKIVRYNVYFTNETTAEDQYNKMVLPAKLECFLEKSDTKGRVFQYKIEEKIRENIELNNIDEFKCEGGVGAELTLPARKIESGESQSIPIGFKGHFSAQATFSTYLYVYLIIFSIMIGILRVLKEAINITRKNLKYFID